MIGISQMSSDKDTNKNNNSNQSTQSNQSESSNQSIQSEPSIDSDTNISSEEPTDLYNIGDTATLNDWSINVTNMQIVNSIAGNFGSFSPKEEGNQYVQLFVTITNNGKQSDSFLPTVSFGNEPTARILYGDGYEFPPTNLLGYSNDLHDSVVNPLSSKTGEIAFNIPQSVATATEQLVVEFEAGNKSVEFKLR